MFLIVLLVNKTKTNNSLKNHKMADFLETEAITDKKQNKKTTKNSGLNAKQIGCYVELDKIKKNSYN